MSVFRRDYLPDLLVFLFGIALAWFSKWETKDFIWSLWLSSLLTGYASILITIASGGYIAYKFQQIKEMKQGERYAVFGGSALMGLFLFFFFSIHFCAFHSGHATFLSSFYPIEGLERKSFSGTFMNPVKLFALTFEVLVPYYGLFVLVPFVAERNRIFSSFYKARKLMRSASSTAQAPELLNPQKLQKGLRDPFIGPYINVIRMHILIFFFAFASMLELDSFLVFVVVYTVYFFPWSELHNKSK